MSSKNNDKVAVITIGRLQPPHKGHDVLIRDTVQLARDLGGVPFVWISPSRTDGRDDLEPGEVPERTEPDPLSISQRFYYLNKMYPRAVYPEVKFLYDMDEDIKLKTQKELNAGRSTLEFPTRGRRKKPDNWKKMTLCQKYKYVSIMEDGRMFNRTIKVRDRAARVPVGGRRLPSAQCLNWLRSRRYTKVILLVGSDRVEAFKTYNQELGDKLFKKFKVDQSGYDRGAAGRQELKPLKLERALSDESIDDLSQMMSGLSISPAEQKERAEEYSGTRTRNAAIEGNIPEFVRAVKEGNMTMFDCFCLCNDVRTRGMPSLSVMRLNQSDFLEALPEEERLEFYQQRTKIKSFESRMIRDGRLDPNYGWQTREEDELYGEEYNPFKDSDLDLGGGRRRKTRKKRRKRRKKTIKKKKKKRKTRRKRGGRRKRRKRKTRKN